MITKLAFVMTDRCTAACDMCCFGCTPRGKQRLETDLIKDVLRQAADIKKLDAVGFTGGEALIYFDQVLECSAYAHSLGLRVTLNSNGFWGNNEARGREMVRALKQAGVEQISFSADRFHQQYVPLDHLRTAMRVASEEGMPVDVSIMETVNSDDIVQMTEALRPEIYQAEVFNHPMLPVGKALETMSSGDFIHFFETKEAKCTYRGLVQMGFDGRYYMCCSQFSQAIPRLNLGDAREVKLADLGHRISSDDYLYVMLKNGLNWFVDRAKALGFDIPDYLCTPCHCCYYVFTNQELQEALAEQVEQEAGRLRLQKLFGL